MTIRSLTAALCGVVLAALVVLAGIIGLSGAAIACVAILAPTDSPSAAAVGYDGKQLANAAIIVSVGAARGIDTRGQIIAVAVAIQESSLRNLDDLGEHNDHDSLGLFQQRPSQGWGTAEQILDPVYASNAFYDRLLTVDGWQRLALAQAAQAVQRSAHPGAYARWESDATALVNEVTAEAGCDGGDGLDAAGAELPAGFTLPAATPTPVAIAIFWALQQRGTPYHFGGSCTDPHAGVPALACDCSSLVQQAYAHAGIALPRTTDDQQHTGTAVNDPADLAPGDLIFIPGAHGTMADPGHVGLYLGSGLIVQAPHTGDVVKISTLEAWRPHIAAIRRIVAPPPHAPGQP